jgi:two-component system, OmpR family, sensor kinase
VSGAGDRLARLLEELDDAVWLLDTKKPLVLEKVKLGEFIDDVIARVSKAAALRQVHLVVETPEEACEFVGDADVLATGLAYVIDLAMLRALGQSVYVTVEVKHGAPFVRVSDEAGAVPDAILSRIFEPFMERELFSREAPTPRRKQRLGLGLPIARAIFEAHGGSLVAAPSSSSPPGLSLSCVLVAAPSAATVTAPRAASG